MRFILRYKYGILQKKTERVYIDDCSMTDQLITYLSNKLSRRQQEFVLRYKHDKICYKIIRGWSLEQYNIKQGAQLELEFLEDDSQETKSKYANNKYLMNILGNHKAELNKIAEEQEQQEQEKEFNVRKYLDSQCQRLLKLVQKGKLSSLIKLFEEVPDAIDEQYIVEIQKSKPKLINELGEGGWAAIHYAVFCNKVDILNQLINRAADINKCTSDGWLPLQLAINRKNMSILRILLTTPSVNVNEVTTRGTALHTAARLSDKEAMTLLLQRDADWKLCDEKGKNCYEVCQNEQSVSIIKKFEQKLHAKEQSLEMFIQQLVILRGQIFKAKTLFLTLKQKYLVLNPFEGTLIFYDSQIQYPKKPRQIIPLTTIKEVKFLKNQQKTWQMKKDFNYIQIFYPTRFLFATKSYKIAERWYNGLKDAVKYQNYVENHKINSDNSLEDKQELILDDKNNSITSLNNKKQVKNNSPLKKKPTLLLPPVSEFSKKQNYNDSESECQSPKMPKKINESMSSRPSEKTSFQSSPSQNRLPIIQSSSQPDNQPQISLRIDQKAAKKQEMQRATKQLSKELNSIVNQKTNFSSFQIIQTLGSGAFGKVFLAKHIPTKKCYALKALKKKTLILKKQLKYAITEANVLKQANNPFIINLHYAFQTPNYLYLALDYCSGKDLSWHLAREMQFPENDARFYIAELLLAIEHLHDKNILYRDLKPENILLDADGHIKLADFGLSKDNVQEKTKSFCGSPAYLSPEMLAQKGVGKQSDIYGIGAVLYEFLVGQPPFYNDDIPTLYLNIKEGKLKFPKNISEDAKSLITGLLERDPKKRLGSKSKQQIKSHPFFADINWKQLMEKKLTPPKREYSDDEQDSDEQIALQNRKANFTDYDYEDSTKKINRLNGFSFVRQ